MKCHKESDESNDDPQHNDLWLADRQTLVIGGFGDGLWSQEPQVKYNYTTKGEIVDLDCQQ